MRYGRIHYLRAMSLELAVSLRTVRRWDAAGLLPLIVPRHRGGAA